MYSYARFRATATIDTPNGRFSRSFTHLDSMRAGQLLPLLYNATGDVRYRVASTQIRERLNTYSRTKEGGFWHAEGGTRDWQNWSDGVYMVVPFIMRHGYTFGEKDWATAEALKQLFVYAKNLQHESGLFHHAYDESRTVSWANPTTGVSPEFWGRAMGWYAITCCDVLEDLPRTHPDRPKLIAILAKRAPKTLPENSWRGPPSISAVGSLPNVRLKPAWNEVWHSRPAAGRHQRVPLRSGV